MSLEIFAYLSQSVALLCVAVALFFWTRALIKLSGQIQALRPKRELSDHADELWKLGEKP